MTQIARRGIKLSIIALLSISLASCAFYRQLRSYCLLQPDFCLFVSIVAAGVLIAVAAGGGSLYWYSIPSDRRLKKNVRHVKTLDNGLKLYSFQYRGDSRNFVGVLAQDVRKLKKYRHAVTRGRDGYLRVNYGKLGLKLYEPKILAEAGKQAVARAR